jgi:hypothetical protein
VCGTLLLLLLVLWLIVLLSSLLLLLLMWLLLLLLGEGVLPLLLVGRGCRLLRVDLYYVDTCKYGRIEDVKALEYTQRYISYV